MLTPGRLSGTSRARSLLITLRRFRLATIKTLHDAFMHEMEDMYDAEHQLVDAIGEMMEQASSKEVKAGLRAHLSETRTQISNLEKAFRSLGAPAERQPCRGMKGLIAEYRAAAKEMRAPELLDGLIVDAGIKAEHYEICSYQGLIDKARMMGHEKAAVLFEENLRMEEAFEKKLHTLEDATGQAIVAGGPELIGHAA